MKTKIPAEEVNCDKPEYFSEDDGIMEECGQNSEQEEKQQNELFLLPPPRDIANEGVHKWDKQIEHQEGRGKATAPIGVGKRSKDQLKNPQRRKCLISGCQHDEKNHIVIENPLECNFAVSPNSQ